MVFQNADGGVPEDETPIVGQRQIQGAQQGKTNHSSMANDGGCSPGAFFGDSEHPFAQSFLLQLKVIPFWNLKLPGIAEPLVHPWVGFLDFLGG